MASNLTTSDTSTPSMSNDGKEERPAWKDCTACRLTGAATFTGIGSYALYQGYNQGAFAKIKPKGAPRGAQGTVVLGIIFIGLGLGRLAV